VARSALRAALYEHAGAGTQRELQARLRRAVDGSLHELPYVFADHLDRWELEVLADALELALEGAEPSR